jgi:hypothetical protein
VCCDCQSTSTFYIDHDSFELATGIYADEELTIPAPDGYYSLGNSSSYRVIIDGVLQPIQVCDDCFPCTVWTGGTFLGAGDVEVEFSYLDCNFVERTFTMMMPANPTPDEAMTYTLSPYICVIQGYVSMTPIEGVSDVTFDFNPEEVCGEETFYDAFISDSYEIPDICGESATYSPILLSSNNCEIANGTIAYNTDETLFPGDNKLYLLYVNFCDNTMFTYVCQISGFGEITVVEQCTFT